MAVVVNGSGGAVDIVAVDGYTVAKNAGNADSGTQRVTLATNDAAIAAQNTILVDGSQHTLLVDGGGDPLDVTSFALHTVSHGLDGSTPVALSVSSGGVLDVLVTNTDLATTANQTNGSQKSQVVDPANNSIGSNLNGTNSLNVNVRYDQSVPVAAEAHATGSGAISLQYNNASQYVLHQVICHFDSAPTTSEDFVITLDSALGSTYDVELMRYDPTDDSAKDIVWYLEKGFICLPNDTIKVTYTNTDVKTYGCAIVVTTQKTAGP